MVRPSLLCYELNKNMYICGKILSQVHNQLTSVFSKPSTKMEAQIILLKALMQFKPSNIQCNALK